MTRRPFVLLLLAFAGTALATGPEFAEVTGHSFGERITFHHEMVRYLEALDEASPRVRVEDQGASWEGRRLLVAIVTSPENHERLDEIRENAVKLGDPRQLPADEVDGLVAGQPAIVWLGGSIHGFELSGAEGLLKLLEHLAIRDDEETRQLLRDTVVLIDPMLNPDGRDAHVHWNVHRQGREPNPRNADWGHATGRWYGFAFRTGHYFFDTNRDWFAHTQPETRHRVATLLKWRPQVAIDAHEMGRDREFYFDPPTEPFGPYFPSFARTWFERFGAAYSDAFDGAGFEYTTGEMFNYYYPGYTTSYNSYQGAVGMLYEQGSTRGLALERGDGSVRRLGDALEQQYTAALTAVRTAAKERESLEREFHAGIREAIDAGGQGMRRYLLAADEGDPVHLRELAELLVRNGIEVSVLTQDAELAGVRDAAGASLAMRSFPAGSYVVEAAQPRYRLLRTLLEPDLPLPEDFLESARHRLDRGENPRFYDITAWSLPLLWNVGGYSSRDARELSVEPLGEAAPPAAAPGKASYAYLVDGRAAASVAVAHHLRERGYRVAVTTRATRVEGEDVASGTAILRVRGHEASVHEAVVELARRFGVGVRAVATGRGEKGYPPLGSETTFAVGENVIAILAEEPVHGYSFGWAWYTLDRLYEIPTTVLPVRLVDSPALQDFDTLVVPDLMNAKRLAERLGESGTNRLKGWVEDGGNLVAVGVGVEFVKEHLGLTALSTWYAENEEKEKKDDEKDDGASDPKRRFTVPGAIFRAELDSEVWLTAGYGGEEVPFLLRSDLLYLPGDGPPDGGRRVAVRIPEEGEILLSGHAWPESLVRLPGTVLAYDERVGAGRVIAFPEDVSFRGFWRGSDRLFLNAVVLGASAP